MPSDSPVTSPPGVTEKTSGVSLDHATVPGSAAPCRPVIEAENVIVSPKNGSVPSGGETRQRGRRGRSGLGGGVDRASRQRGQEEKTDHCAASLRHRDAVPPPGFGPCRQYGPPGSAKSSVAARHPLGAGWLAAISRPHSGSPRCTVSEAVTEASISSTARRSARGFGRPDGTRGSRGVDSLLLLDELGALSAQPVPSRSSSPVL